MIKSKVGSRIVHKHDIEANWQKAVNFIPFRGEFIVYDADEEYPYERYKIGDGTTVVNALPFATDHCISELGGQILGNLDIMGIHQTGRKFDNIATFATDKKVDEIVIKTKIPFLSGNAMPLIHLKGYAYDIGSPIDLTVGWYIYQDEFYNYGSGAISACSWKPDIFLSTYIENNTEYVAVSFKAETYFPLFVVDMIDLFPWGAQTRNYASEWTIEYKLTEDVISIIPTDNQFQVSYKKIANDISGIADRAIMDANGNKINDFYIKRGSYERIEGAESAHKNLNDYTQAGFYNVKTLYVDNCPNGIDIDAALLVYPWNETGYELQEITETSASTHLRRWMRKNNAGTWSDWKIVITGDENKVCFEDGNAWFAGEVTVGEEKNKLATENFVADQINNITFPDGSISNAALTKRVETNEQSIDDLEIIVGQAATDTTEATGLVKSVTDNTVQIVELSNRVETLEQEGPCLIAGTQILMADGSTKAIECLQEGDMIKSWDIDNETYIDVRCLASVRTGVAKTWKVFVFDDDRTLTIFNSHPVYSMRHGCPWPSRQWQVGNNGISSDGKSLEYFGSFDRRDMIYADRYTLVSENNLYFADGVLCGHNSDVKYFYYDKGAIKNLSQEELDLYAQEFAIYDKYRNWRVDPKLMAESIRLRAKRTQAENIIANRKTLLAESDYKTIKYTQGQLTEEEFSPIVTNCNTWRSDINEQESQIAILSEQIQNIETTYKSKHDYLGQCFKECYDMDMTYIKSHM